MVHNERVKRLALMLILLLAIVYAGDYFSVRFKIPHGRNTFGTVTIQRSYSVMKKDGKPDFYFDPPQDVTCVRSIFPHLGCDPCWYLRRHQTQQIKM
jgi:hypothetical protein